ncbi:MAG: BlaI/MecI/CopY family transcriptional regulator [Gammaproteobacteria bacterium]|nr:BlaI/MecI/CopY family transcriptional regulator [Gammaproteobacteria bacterium]
MQWESMGFKDEPFRTQPLTAYTLELYTGNEEKIIQSQFALHSSNMVMVIEGSRGVGTTSFGNFLRFKAQEERKYFTPTSEIRVEPNWSAETLIAAVLANIISTLELHYLEKVKDKSIFKEAKALVQRVTETYRSFGMTAFGLGASYGKSSSASQPMIMPTQVLSQHLEGLVQVAYELGFKYGILIQLNNLDIGVVQEENHIKMLLNIMRDYFQITGTSWLLVGDLSLRHFIAQEVDRVDDIVAFETTITPLSEVDYLAMIDKRVNCFRINSRVELPVDKDVLLYLYHITKGRLRFIFGLLNRLFNTLQVGTLTERVTLDLAKPVVINYSQERIRRFNLSANEKLILKIIVEKDAIQVKEIASILEKKPSHISNILAQLLEHKLVGYTKEWRNHYYYASIDALIAYSA